MQLFLSSKTLDLNSSLVRSTFFLCLLLFVCCKGEEGEPGPAGASGNAGPKGEQGDKGEQGILPRGSIVGYVELYDSAGSVLSSYDEITVSIEGVSPKVEVIPDTLGRFSFSDIPMGTYNLIYRGKNIGTYKYYGVGVTGGSTPTFLGTKRLSKTVRNPIESFELKASGTSDYFSVKGSAKLIKGHCHKFEIYISDSPDVSNSNYKMVESEGAWSHEKEFNFTIWRFQMEGIKKGSTIYVVIYGSADSQSDNYTDIETGNWVNPSVSPPSAIKSMKIPL